MTFDSETALCAPVVPYLQGMNCAVFPEVGYAVGEPVADLVAVHDGRVGVYEAKLTLSAKLLRQAHYWLDKSDAVSLILPAPTPGSAAHKERIKFHPMLATLGFGLLEVDEHGVNQELSPTRQPPGRSARLLEQLCPDHAKHGKAGSKDARYSKTKEMLSQLETFVNANPGCFIKEVAKAIEHPWRSTTTAINRLLEMDLPVDVDKRSIPTRLWPKGGRPS